MLAPEAKDWPRPNAHDETLSVSWVQFLRFQAYKVVVQDRRNQRCPRVSVIHKTSAELNELHVTTCYSFTYGAQKQSL